MMDKLEKAGKAVGAVVAIVGVVISVIGFLVNQFIIKPLEQEITDLRESIEVQAEKVRSVDADVDRARESVRDDLSEISDRFNRYETYMTLSQSSLDRVLDELRTMRPYVYGASPAIAALPGDPPPQRPITSIRSDTDQALRRSREVLRSLGGNPLSVDR